MTDLTDRVVVITGAAERAGRVFAQRFGAAGAAVVVNHLPGQEVLADQVVDAVTAAGGHAVRVAADITDVTQTVSLVDAAVREFGRLDVLVHNASTFVPTPWLDVDEADFERSFGVNLRGPFFLSQAAARVMLAQGEGRIIALVGNSLSEAWPQFVPHGVAKTALARLMEQLAVALAPVVACNSLAPAQFFRSDDGANDQLRATRGETVQAGVTHEVAPGIRLREVETDTVADWLIHLSTCSLQVTGTTIRIDGAKALV